MPDNASTDRVLIDKTISNFIEKQFPQFYVSEGSVFVAFVTAYYKWLESQDQALYHSRRIYDYRDIDQTADDFLIYFKEKYLKKIQLTSETKTRQLVKHSLDLYRSKGTERGLDLLFRAVFGKGTEVYYPGSDLFRLSDGKWMIPRYLEVSIGENNTSLVNRQIVGLNSGATAFVDQVVRRSVQGRFLDLLYISAIDGKFVTGEKIDLSDGSFTRTNSTTIIGSLTNILVSAAGTGSGYAVGDVIPIRLGRGEQGYVRVTSISDITGLVGFELVDGGYGFTINAEVIVSEKVLTLANMSPAANSNAYFWLFEQVKQPLANIHFENANGTIKVGDVISSYYPNNEVKGTGRVLAATTNSIAGEIFVSVSGDLNEPAIYTSANAIGANLTVSNGYWDVTVTANVVGYAANVLLRVANLTGSFVPQEQVVQVDAGNNFISNGIFSSLSNPGGSNGTIKLTNTDPRSIFYPNLRIRGISSGAVANVQTISVDLGVFDIANSFTALEGNFIYGVQSGATANVTDLGLGTGASFNVASLIYTETVEINDDYLRDYLGIHLDAGTYDFPGYPSANLTTGTLDEIKHFANVEIGAISALSKLSRGIGYNKPPIVAIYEPITYPSRKQDDFLTITGTTAGFVLGEEVTQDATGARGLVLTANSTNMILRRLRYQDANNFQVTSNSTLKIFGVQSAATANILTVEVYSRSRYLGLNSQIGVEVQSDTGAITGADVHDSGFGYEEGETIWFGNPDSLATGSAQLGTQGHGRGFYARKGGWLSDQKKLFDGYYYQDYSYEVKTSMALDQYVEMLKQVLHVAGTKPFGAFVYKSINPYPLGLETSLTITA